MKRETVQHDEHNIKGFFDNYRFLSNFEPCDVLFDGIIYPSSENAYQAAKSLDTEVRKKFVDISSTESKKLGKIVEIRTDWNNIKLDIMYSIVFDKFTRNSKLGDQLIETGDKYLEETNYWKDTFWGVCNGVGKNWLGRILMDVREQIR
jgi:ribA/ribD-fused uncharacterized protein